MYETMSQNITPEFATAYTQAVARTTSVVADAENPFHKNSYATLGAHIEATKNIFAQHGLAIVQFPCGDGECVGIETIVIHKDGGFIARKTFIKIPENFKGQDAGSLFSYLRRYAIAACANIATSDDDGEADRVARPQPAQQVVTKVVVNTPAPKPAPVAPKPAQKPAAGSNTDLAKALGFVIQFGKNKGMTLGDLPENSLQWYIKEYQPKPYNGSISEKDMAFRAALDLIRDSRNGKAEDVASDDVPF